MRLDLERITKQFEQSAMLNDPKRKPPKLRRLQVLSGVFAGSFTVMFTGGDAGSFFWCVQAWLQRSHLK